MHQPKTDLPIVSIFDRKHPRKGMTFPKTGRTKQAMRDETDINNIMKRFQATGVIDFVNKQAAVYADVSNLDFSTSMNSLVKAQNMFNALPSSIRKRFGNDPGQFLDFMADPENIPEARKIGLLPGLAIERSDPPDVPTHTEPPKRDRRAPDASRAK